MSARSFNTDIVIGTFYQTEFGVVKTYGFSGPEEIISWYKLKKTKGFNNFYEHGCSKYSETKDWERIDVKDFPDSVDTALPYSFDLYYDIKRMSELRRAFRYEDSDELLEMMRNHGIRFKKRVKHLTDKSLEV